MLKSLRLALILGASLIAAAPADAETPTEASRAMNVSATYRPTSGQGRLAIFLSGDGGWNLGVVSMAQAVANEGYVVLGVDFPHYLRTRDASVAACIPLADDLAATARAAGATEPTLLIGYSSGASAVYGALVQSRPRAFAGGVSLGFAPDLMSKHQLCRGEGLTGHADAKVGYRYDPSPNIGAPWVALQGEIDQVVSPEATREFVGRVPDARAVMLPHVGHGFSVERNWMPQFRDAVRHIETRRDP